MPGFATDPIGGGGTVYATNVDFSGTSLVNGTPQVTSNGQLLIGNAASPQIRVGTITSPSGSITIGYSAPNITLDVTAGGVVVEKFALQSGTSPVGPSAGIVTFNGASVAAGTNPVITNGTGATTMQLQVQRSQAIAAADSTKVGLAAFNSSNFTVDANGFVSTSGTGVLNTLTPNSGTTPVTPTGGTISVLGTGSITTVGSLNTVTIQLTGLTNHAVLVGAGTATITNVGPTATSGQILQSQGASADPAFSTATYPSTTTINQILFSSANNVVGAITAANSAVLVSTSTGVPQWSSTMTNGQVIIGSTGATPTAATLTAGAGISITNGAGTITIAATAAGFTWQTITASQTLVKNNGYMCIAAGGALALALPTTGSSTIGDTIIVTLDGATSWSITQAAAQQIRVSSAQTTAGVGGSVASTAQGDTITLVYQATGRWNATEFVGNLTIT